MLKLHVLCSAMLLLLQPKMIFPQQDQDFKWVSASYVGSIWGSSTAWGYLMARLVPPRGQPRRFGAAHFGPCCFGIVKSNLKIPSEMLSPWPWKRNRKKSKIQPKRNGAKTLIPMAGRDGKRNQTSPKKPPSKRSPQWPCSQNVSRASQNQGPPLAELNVMTTSGEGWIWREHCFLMSPWSEFFVFEKDKGHFT